MTRATSGRAADGAAPRFAFSSTLWVWSGSGGGSWHFVTVPEDVSDDIADLTTGMRGGFGSVKVRARLGGTTFETSLFPSTEHRAYLLPVKKSVRTGEQVSAGDQVDIQLDLLHL
ncbi:MAG: DUF1905 domain-containing protein [Kineosporiaceae bacterium]|nr:DUF1905 domain-containing protein [Kineosporiaceae bacterium]